MPDIKFEMTPQEVEEALIAKAWRMILDNNIPVKTGATINITLGTNAIEHLEQVVGNSVVLVTNPKEG